MAVLELKRSSALRTAGDIASTRLNSLRKVFITPPKGTEIVIRVSAPAPERSGTHGNETNSEPPLRRK